jgi:hypothetical protein
MRNISQYRNRDKACFGHGGIRCPPTSIPFSAMSNDHFYPKLANRAGKKSKRSLSTSCDVEFCHSTEKANTGLLMALDLHCPFLSARSIFVSFNRFYLVCGFPDLQPDLALIQAQGCFCPLSLSFPLHTAILSPPVFWHLLKQQLLIISACYRVDIIAPLCVPSSFKPPCKLIGSQ